MKRKIFFVSLGCDKNLVDSEKMLGILGRSGYEITDDETAADVIVINTCCFINDAK
ncbi:MAG: 30S ribosomal protein S12 methylthiotransferase RimO, partial [Lachnospiraceae bacterium]|nr:30S ribosomal protein S12 methylthiotransferase RimO [Lachnospiraceae bacterium]